MKIVKYLLYVLLVLVLVFFGLGLAKPSVSYGHTIVVDKNIKEAWDVAHDLSKYKLWLEGFQSMELLEGEMGKPGSKYRIIVNPGDGQEDFEMIETVLSKKDYNHITMHFDSEMMDFDQTMTFKNVDGKVEISTDSKVTGKGILMQSTFACMETFLGAFQQQETKNIEALKKVINENTTKY